MGAGPGAGKCVRVASGRGRGVRPAASRFFVKQGARSLAESETSAVWMSNDQSPAPVIVRLRGRTAPCSIRGYWHHHTSVFKSKIFVSPLSFLHAPCALPPPPPPLNQRPSPVCPHKCFLMHPSPSPLPAGVQAAWPTREQLHRVPLPTPPPRITPPCPGLWGPTPHPPGS